MERGLSACYSLDMPTISRNIGANLRRIRERLGLTQVQVSERTGRAQNTLSAWERGAVFQQLDDIEEVITAMGGDPMELLHPARPEVDEVAALFDRADATTRDIVLGILRMRVAGGDRAVG